MRDRITRCGSGKVRTAYDAGISDNTGMRSTVWWWNGEGHPGDAVSLEEDDSGGVEVKCDDRQFVGNYNRLQVRNNYFVQKCTSLTNTILHHQ